MSDHFIGINRGAVGFGDDQVFFATSTTSKDVELRIADAAGWTRQEIILALEVLEAKLAGDISPDVDAKFPDL